MYHAKEDDTRCCQKTDRFEHEFLADTCSADKLKEMIEECICHNLIQGVKRNAIIPR